MASWGRDFREDDLREIERARDLPPDEPYRAPLAVVMLRARRAQLRREHLQMPLEKPSAQTDEIPF